jgi:hypothetical protein
MAVENADGTAICNDIMIRLTTMCSLYNSIIMAERRSLWCRKTWICIVGDENKLTGALHASTHICRQAKHELIDNTSTQLKHAQARHWDFTMTTPRWTTAPLIHTSLPP